VPDAATIVGRMIDLINLKDLDGALALMADDVVWDNVPSSKRHGRDEIRRGLAPFLERFSAVDWVVHHQVANGDVVMNERLDRFQRPDGSWIELPVAGLFLVRDGLVTLWRDYYDAATLTAALAAS
jgi:limonene-1,2-epoxide hydrolase